ncbi:MAPEG family protein [Neiella sp. HB171785]|uniref:MAPEG family protein n=1 Tax=Neiella litorisoli TaxID=2771431 RepID=A0A8J6QKU8_9GAMM|nr:MAPEG family protein [Neiella litorisoli]MBD1391238.1 MAPEG family protein [Neiella litorisoli]
MITGLFVALHGLLLLVLSASVIRLRLRHRVGIGAGEIDSLERAIRVQSNFVEYVPLCLLILAALEWQQAHPAGLFALGGLLLVGRVLHAVGLSASAGESAGRKFGIISTLLVLLAGSLWLLGLSVASLLA